MTGCADGADVDLYSITGEGHEWPGGPHLPKWSPAAWSPVHGHQRQRHHVGLLYRSSASLRV